MTIELENAIKRIWYSDKSPDEKIAEINKICDENPDDEELLREAASWLEQLAMQKWALEKPTDPWS